MRVIVSFLLILISATVFAQRYPTTAPRQQFPSDLWHEGKIILDTGDTLKGTVKYDLQNDLLQFQAKNKNETYTSRKVLLFEIFDGTQKQYRQFYSLPYAATGQYKAPVFFELLEEGKITLLCREGIEYRTYSNPYYYYGSYSRMVLVYKYFLLEENGEIREFNEKKNDWLQLMGNKGEEVQKYAKTNRLSFDDKDELSKIVAYYNSLFQKK
jgi:hypothetical protein